MNVMCSKIISTFWYDFKILFTTDSSCDIQPHTPIKQSGRSCLMCFRFPISPNTLFSAFSLIAHVFNRMTSAKLMSSVGV